MEVLQWKICNGSFAMEVLQWKFCKKLCVLNFGFRVPPRRSAHYYFRYRGVDAFDAGGGCAEGASITSAPGARKKRSLLFPIQGVIIRMQQGGVRGGGFNDKRPREPRRSAHYYFS